MKTVRRIVGGLLIGSEGFAEMGFCLLEDGTMVLMQKHYTFTPGEAKAICRMIEKESPAAGGGEAPSVSDD